MSLRGRLKQASRAIKDAVASGQDDDEATDILVTLKHEHDEVKQLLSDLQDADTTGQRRRLVKQIKALHLNPTPLTVASFSGITPQQRSLDGD